MCDKKVYVISVIPQQTSRAGWNTKSGFSKQLSAMHFYLRMIYLFWNLEDVLLLEYHEHEHWLNK